MGQFIVIEGPNGVGKSYLAGEIASHYAGQMPITLTHEPYTDAPGGQYLEEIMYGANSMECGEWELALHFAVNRQWHLDNIIRPALQKTANGLVICDRYLISSLVYQTGSKGGAKYHDIIRMNNNLVTPDLVILLDGTESNIRYRISLRNKPSINDKLSVPTQIHRYERATNYMAHHYSYPIKKISINGPHGSTLSAAIEHINAQFNYMGL